MWNLKYNWIKNEEMDKQKNKKIKKVIVKYNKIITD